MILVFIFYLSFIISISQGFQGPFFQCNSCTNTPLSSASSLSSLLMSSSTNEGGSSSSRRRSSSRRSSNKAKDDAMLNFIEKPVPNSVGGNPESIPIDDDPSSDLVRTIVKAADGRKAENIVALRVSPISTLTSFLVILSGNSRPQNQAIAAAIKNDVQEVYNLRTMGNGVPEGTAESGWMLLDYGEVMVHIMTPKSRLYYNVEGQWRDKGGMEMDLSSIIVPNTADVAISGTMEIEEEEDDPFWS